MPLFSSNPSLVNRNLYPFFSGFLPFTSESPDSPETWKLSYHQGISNNYRYDSNYWEENFWLLIDGEIYQSSIKLTSPPLLGGVSYTIEVIAGTMTSGSFDPLIRDFHAFFGFPDGAREATPNNEVNIYLREGSTVLYDGVFEGWDLQGINLKVKSKPFRISSLTWGFKTEIKLPMGESNFPISTGGTDIGIQLMSSKKWNKTELILNSGIQYLSKPPGMEEIGFTHISSLYSGSLILPIWDQQCLLIQVQGQTSPYRSGHSRLDSHSSYFNLGYSLSLNDSMLTLSFSEEIFTYAASDIALNINWQFRL